MIENCDDGTNVQKISSKTETTGGSMPLSLFLTSILGMQIAPRFTLPCLHCDVEKVRFGHEAEKEAVDESHKTPD